MKVSCDLLPDASDAVLCRDVTESDALSESRLPWSASKLQSPDGEGLRRWLSRNWGNAKKLFEAMIAPKTKGGLELAFEEDGTGAGRDPLAVYRDRQANCVEFVAFFLAAAQKLGIPAVPIELFEDAEGHRVLHVRIGIQDPKTGTVIAVADLANGYYGPPRDGEKWAPLTSREFLAYYLNLKGVREGQSAVAESYIDFALALNPKNYLLLYNKAYFESQHGNDRRALHDLLQSITNYPRYLFAYENLERVANRLGQKEIAKWAMEQYQKLTSG